MLPKLFFGFVVTLAAVFVFLLGLTILVGLVAPLLTLFPFPTTFAAFARGGHPRSSRFWESRARSVFSSPCCL